MCEDLDATVSELSAHGVRCTAIAEARWGRVSSFWLPGRGDVGIYQPRHPSPPTCERSKDAPEAFETWIATRD